MPKPRLLALITVAVLALIGTSVGATLAVTGGDDDQGEERAADAADTNASTPVPPRDTDGDGIANDADPDPYSAANNEGGYEDDFGTYPDEPAEPAETLVGLNEGARDDGLGFKVLSLDDVPEIPAPDEFSESVFPPPGGKLIAAVIEMTNYGSSAMDPFCGDTGAVLLDDQDRNYNFDGDAALSINDEIPCGDGVAPGFNATVTLPFKVPGRFKTGGLILWNADSGDPDGTESEIVVVP